MCSRRSRSRRLFIAAADAADDDASRRPSPLAVDRGRERDLRTAHTCNDYMT